MRSHLVLASLLGAGMALLISLPSSADQAPSKEKIDKLIEQLGSGNFAEREKATKELGAIGVPALEALRKAIKSDDAEIRKRIEDILPKIERQAESARVLIPKRVHLIYKDTPLEEAVADFGKKSGYSIELHDPDGKLKERKITLDTGETTFWHALGLLCDKAEMSEASLDDLIQMPQAPGANPGGAPPGPPAVIMKPVRGFMPGMMGRLGQLILKDGKAKSLPTDDRSAARIRVIEKSDQFGSAPEGEIILVLEVSLEPKLQWQTFQSIHIEKAVDGEDRQFAQVIPQVEGAPGIAGNPGIVVLPGQAGAQQMQAIMQLQGRRRMMERRMGWSGLNQQVPVQLKRGAKAAKSLKKLQGVLTVQVLTEARPVITADNLDKAAGKTFKGEEGGSIKIVDVKAEENQTTIQLVFEQPPYDRVVPAQPNVLPGVGIRNVAPRGMMPPPPPAPPAGKLAQPPAVQRPAGKNPPGLAPIIRAGVGPMQQMDSISGLSIRDDKGQTIPIDGGRCQVSVQFDRQANGPARQVLVWTLVCPHEKETAKPSKVVYLGRKSASVEIPFTLKDVSLP